MAGSQATKMVAEGGGILPFFDGTTPLWIFERDCRIAMGELADIAPGRLASVQFMGAFRALSESRAIRPGWRSSSIPGRR